MCLTGVTIKCTKTYCCCGGGRRETFGGAAGLGWLVQERYENTVTPARRPAALYNNTTKSNHINNATSINKVSHY